MNIYLLLELIILIFLVSLVITRDIFSPACIMCETYFLATFCAILSIDKWNINLHNNTVFIIIFGIISFVLVSLIVNIYYKKKNKVKNEKELKFKKYHKKTMIILIAVQIACLFIYLYFFLKALGDLSKYDSLNYLMRYFRFFVDIENDIPTLVNQLLKYSKALAYVSGYIFIHNKFVEIKTKQKSHDNYLLISILIFMLTSLLTAGRFEMMILILSLVVMWYIVMSYYNNKGLKINTFIKLVFVLVLAIVLFSVSKTIVGRQGDGTIIDDFAEYFGGSIEIFDVYLQEEIKVPNKVELFSGVLKFLRKLNLIESSVVDTGLATYVESNGNVVGNVYTGLRRIHHDFGVFGIMIFQMILAFIITVYYEKIKNMKKIDNVSIGIIFYSAISFSIFLHSYSEFFFSTIISFNYLAFFVLIIAIKYCITKIKI